jgi:hypothetical protein
VAASRSSVFSRSGGARWGASTTGRAKCYLQYFAYAPMHTSLFFKNFFVKRIL